MKIYRYEMKEEHYKGIDILQGYYGKKISTSNKEHKESIKEKIKRLQEIKDKSYYTTLQRIWLNDLRLSYIMDKGAPYPLT